MASSDEVESASGSQDNDQEGATYERKVSEQLPDWQRAQRRRPWLTLLANVGRSLVTSFLQAFHNEQDRAAGSLAALDGLRGLACIAVLNQHYTSAFTGRLSMYGYKTSETDVYLPQWPFVRIFWTGSAQVFTFFVISGYVLSVKPHRQMRSQDPAVFRTLTSSVFRRGMRLFLPSIAVLIIVGVVSQLGLYRVADKVKNIGLIADPTNINLPAESAWDMVREVKDEVLGMTNFFNSSGYMPALQQHLWTINVEFRNSMLLYLFQMGTARLRSWLRLLIYASFVVYLGYMGRTHSLLFFSGGILAELDLILQDYRTKHTSPKLNDDNTATMSPGDTDLLLHQAPVTATTANPSTLALPTCFHNHLLTLTTPTNPLFRTYHLLTFLLALYLMCSPWYQGDAPGYFTLIHTFTPSWFHASHSSFFLWSLGSLLAVSAAVHSPDVSFLFTNRFSLYFGKISYALYFVHGPGLNVVSYGLLGVWDALTKAVGLGGRETQGGFAVQWVLGAVVAWPVVVCVADLGWRGLDRPSVWVARWCEGLFEDRRWRVVKG